MHRSQFVRLPAELGVGECALVFDDEILLAMVALLEASHYGADAGKWHVEASQALPECAVADATWIKFRVLRQPDAVEVKLAADLALGSTRSRRAERATSEVTAFLLPAVLIP